MKAIGIMSGTSLDGIDVCLIDISEVEKEYKYEIASFGSYPYSSELVSKIMEASKLDTSNVQKICSLNFEISYAYVDAINKFLKEFKVDLKEIEYIAIHGQTIWHNPLESKEFVASTLQIGEPSVIAYAFNKKVISNFRTMDMAAGGSGAPLIPFVDYLLYKNKTKNIALQNIGGIGNVCYIKKNCDSADVIAFDTGPGNMLIDGAMIKLFNQTFDNGGKIASNGEIDWDVLEELLDDDYLKTPLPKSTGREKYNQEFLDMIINKVFSNNHSKEDVIATITAYTAYSIVDQYKKFLGQVDEVVVSGGGSHNNFILEILRKELNVPIIVENRTDAFEAFGFAILGHMTLLNKPSNMPSVTGAMRQVVLGNITNPPYEE